MIVIKEVQTKKDRRAFVRFPLRLYKNCPYFVPPLYGDEMKLLKNGGKTDVADAVFYLAVRDGIVVGRVQGILQKQYNDLHAVKQVRFTRFDCIDDDSVAKALLDAVEAWARKKGMTELCGPLGYTDLDREGLLVEGFEEISTFEEQYNYPYYGKLIEAAGFEKDVDWLEYELRSPEKRNEMLSRVASRAMEINRLHVASTALSKRKYIAKYRDGFFDCLDECYRDLYGTVPIGKTEQNELIKQFLLLLNKKYIVFICDKAEQVVGFGLCFPAFGNALKKSGGRLTPLALLRLLAAVKHPKAIDLGLVAVRPAYQKAGVNAILLNGILDMLEKGEIKSCETNLNLETNVAVQAQWKYFSARQHKRRRAYKKEIGD